MSAQLLRQKYNRRLVGMERYPVRVAWAIVGSYLAQIFAAIAIGYYLLSLPGSVWTAAGVVVLALFIGTRLRGLNNIVHECSHATFAEKRADNIRIGSFCASVTLGCFHDYRDEHLTHHAHLGDYEHDLDLKRIEKLRIHEPLSWRTVLRHALNPFLLRHLPYYVNPNFGARDGKIYQAMKVGIVLAASLFTAFVPLTGLFLVFTPLFLVFPTLNYWADCLDHAGLTDNSDDLDASRNILAPYMLRVMFFPRNDCFHLVHHLFPHVPARHLGTGHTLLTADATYASRPNAVRPHAGKQQPQEVIAGAE